MNAYAKSCFRCFSLQIINPHICFLVVALLLLLSICACADYTISSGPLKSSLPQPHQVFQRLSDDTAAIPLFGQTPSSCNLIEARLSEIYADGTPKANPRAWTTIDTSQKKRGASFSGALTAPAGWYQLEIRFSQNETALDTLTISPVGIGEVFITAGQSNSANYGEERLVPKDARVSAWSPYGWKLASDPQPVATGSGGSPWPHLGDLLAKRYDVPIGFLSIGWGGTTVGQWLPSDSSNSLFGRITFVLNVVGRNGVRAILWHQGESDLQRGTSTEEYTHALTQIIETSRNIATWEVPWIIARASYLPSSDPAEGAQIVEAQLQVIDSVPLVYEGPNTDDLIGEPWRYDAVHFNRNGLMEHAKRWDVAIAVVINQ